ncbi:MAG: FAD-dependent oxidoreductase, partial [Methylotenera sp.]|nr:FAD-dependent oxidoreductase [Oligoflexia bacterium]
MNLKKSEVKVHVVGSGLAGSEAAYFLAERGIQVLLHEMRPERMTEAHKTDRCAELVCSNSFKSMAADSAPGMLKAEMVEMGSLVLKAAKDAQVPGGQALAVDRDVFAEAVTKVIHTHPNITLVPGEVTAPF